MVKIKRVYEEYDKKDGYRILIDRLWPRGLSKEKAHIDFWFKEIAPGNSLRKWFGHDPKKWEEFERRYDQEISNNKEFAKLKQLIKEKKSVTLLYAAKDTEHNNAVVLLKFFKE
ncbi:MAG: DUF488 domain-containing protein [Patescibacteria group bacterium]|nr:DUF488 domain-containing protein [Patescibacteria group bacterium]